jgi:hypothetical protein
MSPKVLSSTHAEDVGNGLVVEPGQPIPSDADPDVVKRLESEGRVSKTQAQSKPPKKEE